MTDSVPQTTTIGREYTREEMRVACRNNYNAAIEKAAEECDRHASDKVAAYLAKRIRLLTLRGSDDGAGQSAGWGWEA